MLPSPREKNARVSHSPLFWAAIMTLMVVQIAAFWMLCSQQVRKAEVRDAAARQESLARADCLRTPKATLNSCAVRPVALQPGAGAPEAAGAALAVSFTLR